MFKKMSAVKKESLVKIVMFLAFAISLLLSAEINAEMKNSQSGKMMMADENMGDTAMADGIKAVFKFTPSYSMVDLVLIDASTGQQITKAKVSVDVTDPKGRLQKKELISGKMGEKYSFMNTLDVSEKGSYKVTVFVELDGKRVNYSFGFEVK